MTTIEGTVVRILSDDTEGDKHQRFIVEKEDGRTLLIAHNIDMAPRLFDINIGKRITVTGDFEGNEKGGLIHWTHKDPDHEREGGWIDYQGRRFE